MITEREMQLWMEEAAEAGVKTALVYMRAKMFPNLPAEELEEHKRELQRLLVALS